MFPKSIMYAFWPLQLFLFFFLFVILHPHTFLVEVVKISDYQGAEVSWAGKKVKE